MKELVDVTLGLEEIGDETRGVAGAGKTADDASDVAEEEQVHTFLFERLQNTHKQLFIVQYPFVYGPGAYDFTGYKG